MGSTKIRPPPLRINKESQRIRKPPLPLSVVQRRRPVIVHTYSPKVIQTEPSNFMSLVQKLTGKAVEAGLNVHANEHCFFNSVTLQSPVSSTCPPAMSATARNYGQVESSGILISPKSPLPPVKVEAGLYQSCEDTFCLTPGPLLVRSPFTALTSPQLWSPIPSPNTWTQRFFAELPSLSPRLQAGMESPFSSLPVLFPQVGRFGDIIPPP